MLNEADEAISPDDHPVVVGAESADDGEAEENEELAARGQTARVNAWLLASFRDSLDFGAGPPVEWARWRAADAGREQSDSDEEHRA